MIFVTLMLPVEVRICPTYKVVSDLGMLNTYAGLTVPLIASATATFLFRQFFLTVPDELVEAARIDGAGPMRFFKDVLVPLSTTSIAALFVIQFIYGWNQYLWPLLVTTDESMYPVVMGIKRMIGGGDAANEWNVDHGHRDPGDDPAGAGGDADAAVVRQGPGRHGEIRQDTWAAISLRNVVKRYGHGAKANQVIHGVNAEIADGEFIVIVGPSGCGKSTLLRMVAGLEEISGGEIAIGERVVNDIEPAERDIAMVFQNYALYPHMSVFDNMAYGLKIAKVPKAEIEHARRQGGQDPRARPRCSQRKPRELSGGQRQRVAMGRAIVRQPQVFLFDEPLSNLDAKLRAQTRLEIQKLHARARRHLAVRHARPGRGDDAGAAHDRDERRPHGADRHARGGLSRARPPPSSPASSARRR